MQNALGEWERAIESAGLDRTQFELQVKDGCKKGIQILHCNLFDYEAAQFRVNWADMLRGTVQSVLTNGIFHYGDDVTRNEAKKIASILLRESSFVRCIREVFSSRAILISKKKKSLTYLCRKTTAHKII